MRVTVQPLRWQTLTSIHVVQVIGEELAYGNAHSRGFRTILFIATKTGFALVALLQLIHDGD